MFDPIPSIAQLKINLHTMKTNEPINRQEGKIEQAELERANAKSFEGAIDMLSKYLKRPKHGMWNNV